MARSSPGDHTGNGEDVRHATSSGHCEADLGVGAFKDLLSGYHEAMRLYPEVSRS